MNFKALVSIFSALIAQAQVPLPKVHSVADIDSNLRPISLMATLTKVWKSFDVEWILDCIYTKLDPKQFAAIRGSSAVDALTCLLHFLYANTDGNVKILHIFLLDFGKAFDHINYKILIAKMSKLDIYPSVTNWVIDFLSGRKQRVKIGDVFSEWSSVNGGVPQGTVLGPTLLLTMINDLAADHDRRWKFVDDTSVFEVISRRKGKNSVSREWNQ